MVRPPRTAPCSEVDARSRLKAAQAHLEVAELVLAGASSDQYAAVACSLAVLAGIAASDALTCRRLGLVHRGENHQEATALVEGAVPDGRKVASTLRRLLALKDASNYGLTPLSMQKARDAVRWARLLVERAQGELEA